MKNLKQYILTGLFIGLAGASLTACSDDEPKYLKHDIKAATDLFSRMSNGEVEAAYKLHDSHTYYKHENTGNKWEEEVCKEGDIIVGGLPDMRFTSNHNIFL